MDDIFKLFDSVIQQTATKQTETQKCSDKRWKYCVSLIQCGWKATGFDEPDENSADIIMTWEKEGKKTISVRLNFTEQRLLSRWISGKNE